MLNDKGRRTCRATLAHVCEYIINIHLACNDVRCYLVASYARWILLDHQESFIQRNHLKHVLISKMH